VNPPHQLVGTERADYVRRMFDAVARRYDFLNHFLSAGTDRRWRRRAAEICAQNLAAGHAGARQAAPLHAPVVLDLCAGTGDLAMAVAARCPEASVIACDFSRPMLDRAARKFARSGAAGRLACLEADALALPLADASVDAVTCGFGLRNLADRSRGLAEMVRVLRPGGAAVILEFYPPRGYGPWARAFGLYFRRILPRLGAWISGADLGGYQYLVDSIEAFGPPESTLAAIAGAGLAGVRTERLFGGMVAVFVGHKPN